MKRFNRRILGFSAALAMCLAIHVDASITVTPANMNGWAFSADAIGAVGQMVTGPGTPPLGLGSAQLGVPTGQGDNSSQLLTSSYTGTQLSSLISLSYSTYDTANNGQQFPYLKLYISRSGNGTINDALYFEPPYQTPTTGNSSLPNQGNPVLNTWQTWDALVGGWWSDDPAFAGSGGTHVKSLADYLALYPGATIGVVRFAVGYAAAGFDYNGYIDNFTIGTAAGTTTYDFEPAPVPEPTTMIAGALLLLPFGASAFRKLRKNR